MHDQMKRKCANHGKTTDGLSKQAEPENQWTLLQPFITTTNFQQTGYVEKSDLKWQLQDSFYLKLKPAIHNLYIKMMPKNELHSQNTI